MDNGRAATIFLPVVANAVYDRFAHCMFAAVRSTALGRDAPGTSSQTELVHCPSAHRASRTVVIGELNVLVELQPLFVPTPQRSPVNAALTSGHCHGQSL